MTRDGSPEHLTWDGLNKSESEEIKSGAENAPPPPDSVPNGFVPPPPRRPDPSRESRLDPGRVERIRLAALRALARRRNGSAQPKSQTNFEPGIDPSTLTFKQPPGLLPTDVRKNLQGDILPQVSPAMMRSLNWTANTFQTYSRLMIYGFAALRWAFAIFWDKLMGQDTIERRAVRLREAIERIGGSAVKVGQQMAMRIDLLPYEYTVELAKMLDRMPTFPTKYAIDRIETVMGKPLLEVFGASIPFLSDPLPWLACFRRSLRTATALPLKSAGPASGRNLSRIAMRSPLCFSSSSSSQSFVPDCRGISYTNSAAC